MTAAAMIKRPSLHAAAAACPAIMQGPQLMLMLEWDEPFGGSGTDMFEMPAEGVLHVSSTINVHGKTCKYRSVYNKK